VIAENENAVESDEPTEIEHSEAAEADSVVTEVDSAAADSAIEYPGEPPADPKRTRVVRGLIPALLVALLVASAIFAGTSYFLWHRADERTNAVSSDVVLKAATDGATAMLSYTPQTMDKDFATAKSYMTGDFLKYYTDFTNSVVAPAVKDKGVKKQTTVVRAAVSELHPDSATVLAFLNQVTASKDDPDGSYNQSSVKIGLKKVDGKWLMATFDPI